MMTGVAMIIMLWFVLSLGLRGLRLSVLVKIGVNILYIVSFYVVSIQWVQK